MMCRLLLFIVLLYCSILLLDPNHSWAAPQPNQMGVETDYASENEVNTALKQQIELLKLQHQQSDKLLALEIKRLNTENEVLKTVVKNLVLRIEALENTGPNRSVDTSSPEILQSHETIDSEEQARIQREAEENYQLVQEAFEQRLVKEGGMLLSPYDLIYEPSFSYAHSSYDKIVVDGFTIFPVLVVGDIVSEQVRRDILTNQHSFHLGLPWDMQFDFTLPVGYEQERIFREDGTTSSKNVSGLGDISLSLSHQLVKSCSFWPDTVVGINWKPATGKDPYAVSAAEELALGSGFETWGLSATFMTSSDPMVLFAGLSTTYTPGEDKQIGHVKPGESYGLSLGMALALNFDTSLSFNYQYRYNVETEINNRPIEGSDLTTSTFSIGLSRSGNFLSAVDIDLAIGLTQDSPDFQLMVSFPFRFSLLSPD